MSLTQLVKNLCQGYIPRQLDLEKITQLQLTRIIRDLYETDVRLKVSYLHVPGFDNSGEKKSEVVLKDCTPNDVNALLLEQFEKYPIAEINRSVYYNTWEGRERHYLYIHLSERGTLGLKEIPSFSATIEYERPISRNGH